MLIKWIKCQVNEFDKTLFSNAQCSWSKVKNVDGFLGQIGGWDKHNQCVAGIISFWKDNHSYKNFMENIHDEIFENSNQRNTYSKISTNIYEKLSNISSADMTNFLSKGEILRVADCLIVPGTETYFEKMQQEVWNKGMSESNGMLSGVFCKDKNDNERYLVASIWKDESLHQYYVKNKLPLLIKRSAVKEITKNISGNLIEINSKWTVI